MDDDMVQLVVDRLEPAYLITCERCGSKQILPDLAPANPEFARELARDLLDHRWLIVQDQLWCSACVEGVLR